MVRPVVNKTHGKDYEEFGKKVAEAREIKGLSQKEASSILGIPQSTYAGYETGTRKVPLSVIKELSSFYEVSADKLLSSEDSLTLAAHRIDGYDNDLPDEAKEELNNFIDYLKVKYRKKDSDDKV